MQLVIAHKVKYPCLHSWNRKSSQLFYTVSHPPDIMLFRKRNSTAARRKESQEAARQGRQSQDGRRSFSDVLSRNPFDFKIRDGPRNKRQKLGTQSQDVPRGTPDVSPTTRPVLSARFSEDAGRTSVSSWILSQQGVDQVPELPDVFRHGRDITGELRTTKGDSLSLFPRPQLKRSPSSISLARPGSRSSLASAAITGNLSSPIRASTERLADGLRTSGRRLKHSASKLSLVSMMDESEEADKFRALKSPCKVHAPRRCDCQVPLIWPISPPLDFRHVTHALPQQFKNISNRSQSDLVADFSTVRASQLAHLDIRGIKTQDLRSCRSSLDGTASSQISSTVPSLMSSSSYDSLHSARPSSQASEDGTIRSSTTMVSRQSSIVLARSKGSFSRPFPNGRPPRIDSLPRLYQPSHRTFSVPFYAGNLEGQGQTRNEASMPSPVDDLLSEIENWSTSFAPELPTLNEAEVLT